MFDFYSQCTEHARLVAWLHPNTLPTWPDTVRQCHDADIDANLHRAGSKNPLSVFASGLSAPVRRPRPSAERAWVHTH